MPGGGGSMTDGERVNAIAAAIAAHYPQWPPLGDHARDAIRASVEAAPPLTEEQRRRIGRLLRASTNWEAPQDERGQAV